jgi:hypothetical protein
MTLQGFNLFTSMRIRILLFTLMHANPDPQHWNYGIQLSEHTYREKEKKLMEAFTYKETAAEAGIDR